MIRLIQGKYEIAKEEYIRNMVVDFFEFHFDFVSKNEIFRELDRFIWESKRQNTRFANFYKGPVLIDLTEWNQNELNEYFDAFMYFLKDHSCLECTFIVQDECEKELLDRLSSFFEITIDSLEVRREKTKKRQIGFCFEEEKLGNVRSEVSEVYNEK